MTNPAGHVAGPNIAVEPDDRRNDWLGDAIRAGGGHVVDPAEASALIWAIPRHPERLAEILRANPGIRWVQLPFAGIDNFRHLVNDGRTWACGKGVYAEPVAEMAFALLLAGLRGVGTYARRTSWDKHDANALGTNLLGANVTVLGGGSIATSLLRLMTPFHVDATVVRRHPDVDPLAGSSRTFGLDHLDEALRGADAVVLALALVPETAGIINARTLSLLDSHTWIVNVARGGHIATDDLVAALQSGQIGGAALDVTDPEPLPDGHPLWGIPNVIITPHVGNTPQMAVPLLSSRVRENVARWAAGTPLVGLVDPALGY